MEVRRPEQRQAVLEVEGRSGVELRLDRRQGGVGGSHGHRIRVSDAETGFRDDKKGRRPRRAASQFGSRRELAYWYVAMTGADTVTLVFAGSGGVGEELSGAESPTMSQFAAAV